MCPTATTPAYRHVDSYRSSLPEQSYGRAHTRRRGVGRHLMNIVTLPHAGQSDSRHLPFDEKPGSLLRRSFYLRTRREGEEENGCVFDRKLQGHVRITRQHKIADSANVCFVIAQTRREDFEKVLCLVQTESPVYYFPGYHS